jgi:hypothetical protein
MEQNSKKNYGSALVYAWQLYFFSGAFWRLQMESSYLFVKRILFNPI